MFDCLLKTEVRNRISPAMLDRLNEQRSGRVDTFLIIEWLCEGAEGNLGITLLKLQRIRVSSFLVHLQKNQSL